MQKYFGLSKYSVRVITLYILLSPFLFIFIQNGSLHYDFTYDRLVPVVIITLFTIFIFAGYLFWTSGVPDLKLSRILKDVLYGLIIAFPEEIIFRGIIQSFFQIHFANTAIVILLSSLIFGVIHLSNGANNIRLSGWNWRFAGLAFLAGFPLGFIFSLTNSLLVPTLLHAFFVVCLQLFKKWKKL